MAKASLEIVLVDKAGTGPAATTTLPSQPITKQQAGVVGGAPGAATAPIGTPQPEPTTTTKQRFKGSPRKKKTSNYTPPDNAAEWKASGRTPPAKPSFFSRIGEYFRNRGKKSAPEVEPVSRRRAAGVKEPSSRPVAAPKVKPPPPPPKAPPTAAEAAAMAAKKAAGAGKAAAGAGGAGGGMFGATGEAVSAARGAAMAGGQFSLGGAMASVGRLAAAAGPAGIAIGALAAAAGTGAMVVKKYVDVMSEQVERLKGLSGPVAMAAARNDARALFSDLQRAQRIGPNLARFEDTKGRFEQRQAEIWTNILDIALRFFEIFEPTAEMGLKWLEDISNKLEKNKEKIVDGADKSLMALSPLYLMLRMMQKLFPKIEDELNRREDGDFNPLINELMGAMGGRAPVGVLAGVRR